MAILKPNSARAPAPMKQPAGRPTLPSQIAPVMPVQAPTRGVSQPRPQPTNPFVQQPVMQQPVQGGPGRGPMIRPGAGGGMMPQPAPQPQMPGQMVPQQPPVFNIPSPVPVLGQIQPPATNLNPTPGQISNQVPPPAPGMTPAAPLGQAPATIGAEDAQYQDFLQYQPDFNNQYGAGTQQAYDAYQQIMAQPPQMAYAQPGGGGGIMNLPGMSGAMMPGMMPQTQY